MRKLIYADDVKAQIKGGMAIDALPDAREQRRRRPGRWIDRGYAKLGYRCSECGGFSIDGKYNYCPHCGIKMEVNHETD